MKDLTLFNVVNLSDQIAVEGALVDGWAIDITREGNSPESLVLRVEASDGNYGFYDQPILLRPSTAPGGVGQLTYVIDTTGARHIFEFYFAVPITAENFSEITSQEASTTVPTTSSGGALNMPAIVGCSLATVGADLADQYGSGSEIPEFPVARWTLAVGHGHTRLGYWEWAAEQIMAAQLNRAEAAFLESGGTQCPSCRSDDIQGGPINIDGPTATQSQSCGRCQSTWNANYTLKSVSYLGSPSN